MSPGGLVSEVLAYGLFWLWLLGLIPAAVVSILKGRWLLFAAGWITFGITWFLGAIPLADPRSEWARRFYGPERMARADDPSRNRRPGRVTALWASGALCLLLVVGLFAARPGPVIGVGGDALQHSVGGTDLFDPAEPCQPRGDGVWECHAYDREVSSKVPYRVKVHRSGCWEAAEITFPGERSSRRLSGCIKMWDELRPLDGVF